MVIETIATEVIIREVLLGAGVVVLGVLAKSFSSWVSMQKEKSKANDVWDALNKGVKLTKSAYVDKIKKSSKDGKLTNTEIANAKKKALDTAISLATNSANKIISKTASNVLDEMIESLLNDNKK